MREFWMRLMSLVVIVGLILGYNSVLEARAKMEQDTRMEPIPEKRMDLVELLKWK